MKRQCYAYIGTDASGRKGKRKGGSTFNGGAQSRVNKTKQKKNRNKANKTTHQKRREPAVERESNKN